MFESLSEKLQNVFKRLRSKGALTEAEVDEALREVRLVLLEADVNYKVVKEFISSIRERATGQDVLKGLNPAQQVIKIVNEQLVELLGGEHVKMKTADKPPTVVMVAGLHGAGKTTYVAKLANSLKKQGRTPLLVAGDVYRPAAIKQLRILGEQVGVDVFDIGDKQDAVAVGKAATSQAHRNGNDYVLIDVAGRLHIDEEMMSELKRLREAVEVTEVLLVVDAMTGQDAVNVAKQFNEALEIDGVVMTKMDGDARGGAALSVKSVTGKPIKYIGTSEKMDGIEPFHPDRMASRILGMGDVLSLIEKAEQSVDEDYARQMERKLREDRFDLNDYLDQLQQMRKMGPLDQILGMIPGLGNMKQFKDAKIDDKQFNSVEAVLRSMTVEERSDPSILNGSRRRRIADGSGTSVQEVNALVKQFDQMRKMIRAMSGGQESGMRRRRMADFPFMS
ncbi:MAG: signal recognition particle protein [Armatimonadetes bacterium RBG_16_58_9]|nr:MAG: signal recognition particle protein [Armatimonadetes bacterium RBG_16_58_9]